jgi:AraC-like DNA-binding protein
MTKGAQADKHRQARMIELLGRLAPSEGYTLSALDGVKFMRADGPVPRTPVLYEPSIVIVCQGQKRGFIAGKTYRYDAQQFLVLTVPLPFESETIASPAEPMLAVSIRIHLPVAAELVLALDDSRHQASMAPVGISSTPLDDKLSDAVLRLLQALASPLEAKILGPGIVREIHYRVLDGQQGPALRAALAHQSHFGKIAKALRRIHTDYDATLDVETLAADAGMSIATFHANFKAVTTSSPMQYLKTTRLHKARLLMVQDGVTAAAAAARVGYESASQFSREFKRLFGRTPIDEASKMKRALILMPAESETPYITAQ